ncbi:MAG: hypothetical protein AAGB22_02910, partial [Bacteroidota bacterium]
YLEGYARINGYGYDSNGPFFCFKGSPSGAPVASLWQDIDYGGSQTSKREFPRRVCQEFYKAQRRMKIDGGQNVTAIETANDSEPGEDLVQAFVNIMEKVGEPLTGKCREMDPAMSYVRVQVPAGNYKNQGATTHFAKRGGGVRVKRLITFDPGIDAAYSNGNDVGVIYGSEYEYTTKLNGSSAASPTISSGVATNEPGPGRRENALVKPIDKDAQSNTHAFFYGRDMYGQEGPLGESVMPGPSVGYSKVRVIPIYQGPNSTGTEVHEFHTVRNPDHAFKAKRTKVQQTRTTPVSASLGYMGIGISYSREEPNLAQGYEFTTFGMHGKPLAVTKYATGMETNPISQERYEYFGLEDDIELMGDDLQVHTVKMKDMGREVEMLFESRRVYDFGVNASIGSDFTAGAVTISPPPWVLPGLIPTKVKLGGGANEAIFDTHVTTTIKTYPALVKSVTTISEGVKHISENLIFDDHSGNAVVTRSYDDFYSANNNLVASANQGIFLNQDFQGSWKYANFKSRFYNEDLRVTGNIAYGTSGSTHYLKFAATAGGTCGDLQNFVRGDYIQVNSSGGSGRALFHIDRVDFAANRLYLQPSQHSNGTVGGSVSSIDIIRSGYTNRLNDKVGNIVFFERGSTPAAVQFVNNLDGNHALVQALNGNSTLMNMTPGTGQTGINLVGPFPNMDMSVYSSQILAACATATPSDIDLNWVNLLVEYTAGGELILNIPQFEIDCNGTKVIVNCP